MGAREVDRACLLRLFEAAVDRARPANCLGGHLPSPGDGRTVVVGAGKAAGAMAEAFEAAWHGDVEGLVVTRDGYARPTRHIRVVEAAHPVPDERGLTAAREILDLVTGLGPEDQVICLLSGGGSALLTCPVEGVSLAAKQQVTRELLRCGAPIGEINTVRRRLSAIKGGGLARAAAPAKVVTLAISDVVGDDPAVIASGPTVPDPTSPADALAVLAKYGIEAPAEVRRHLEASSDAPDGVFPLTDYRLIARPRDALDAAKALAEAEGLRVIDLGDTLEGEARDVAPGHADMARRLQHEPGDSLILSGGELTVTVRNAEGLGGPNREYAMALALALDGAGGISALAADTDGVDGAGEAAGAIVDPSTRFRAREAGIDLGRALADNDTHRAFERLGDLVATGPTFTNVNDFRAIIIRSRAGKFHAP
ncbi:glycerate kinase type-2 family protein [Minwuia thermotolerans]|uniref:Glycerate kinase n=1 Tax=Minwuia thermotolerans TaxID=2056226 RepID=A0A2M9FVM6_9PROT|nr:glycerate kinase [Minwuia thermotolerans]PJK27528.1 glycerate kinase [Minwuia thermotolerans]